MAFNKDLAYEHVLCMELKANKFKYAILHRNTKEIVELKEFDLNKFERSELEDLLKESVFQNDFGAICLVSGLPRNTLVPNDIFVNSTTKDIFGLNYTAPFEDLDHNRIPELGIVNIYEMPLWIKSLFVIKFPRIRIIHPSTIVLKGVFDQPNFHPKIHMYIDDNEFYYIITENNKLQYFNRFDYKELADIIYHLLFVLEQKELAQDTMGLYFYGVNDKWEMIAEFQKYFKKTIKVSNKPEMAEQFMLAKQLLCVL